MLYKSLENNYLKYKESDKSGADIYCFVWGLSDFHGITNGSPLYYYGEDELWPVFTNGKLDRRIFGWTEGRFTAISKNETTWNTEGMGGIRPLLYLDKKPDIDDTPRLEGIIELIIEGL